MGYPTDKYSCLKPIEKCYPVKFRCIRYVPRVVWDCYEKEFPCPAPECRKEHKCPCKEHKEEPKKHWFDDSQEDEDWED